MIAKSTKDFQNKVLKKMTFSAYPKEYQQKAKRSWLFH